MSGEWVCRSVYTGPRCTDELTRLQHPDVHVQCGPSPVSAPTPSPERRGEDRLEVPRHAACGSIIAHGPHLGCDGLTYPSYDGGWLTDAEADRDLPAPDPRSPEDGAGAPTPFETFQAGMFAGIMAERVAGRDPQDWTEGEVRREFRDWLEERAAATPANGATR